MLAIKLLQCLTLAKCLDHRKNGSQVNGSQAVQTPMRIIFQPVWKQEVHIKRRKFKQEVYIIHSKSHMYKMHRSLRTAKFQSHIHLDWV